MMPSTHKNLIESKNCMDAHPSMTVKNFFQNLAVQNKKILLEKSNKWNFDFESEKEMSKE